MATQIHSQWQKLFSNGNFKELVQQYQSSVDVLDSEMTPLIVGAHVFLGNHLEASLLAQDQEDKLTLTQQCACLFYLSISETRRSSYQAALKIIEKLQAGSAKDKTDESKFYYSYARGFLHYYCGELEAAKENTIESYRLALKIKKPFFLILSQDVLGNCRVMTGEFGAGLELLKKSQEIAQRESNLPWYLALKTSSLIYESEYGYRKETILEELSKYVQDQRFQDTYSQITLGLELARQYLLRGDWDQAEKSLNETSPKVFSSENRRQEIALNICWARLWLLKGQKTLSMQFARSAKQLTNSEKDKSFELKILMLEAEIAEKFKQPLDSIKSKILQLCIECGEATDKNKLIRWGWLEEIPALNEDRLHTFIQELKTLNTEKFFQRVLQSGYLSFLFEISNIPQGEEFLLLSPSGYEAVSFSNYGIRTHKLTKTSYNFLLSLQLGESPKEKILATLWGYDYDPLRHDSLIYSAASQLRKHLGNLHSWLISDDSLYSFNVKILNIWNKNLKVERAEPELIERKQDLNYRQLEALSFLAVNQYVEPRKYREIFQVSEMTATRDLAALKGKGYVIRVGHGRAVRYKLKAKGKA